jgi:hypothetical protein
MISNLGFLFLFLFQIVLTLLKSIGNGTGPCQQVPFLLSLSTGFKFGREVKNSAFAWNFLVPVK